MKIVRIEHRPQGDTVINSIKTAPQFKPKSIEYRVVTGNNTDVAGPYKILEEAKRSYPAASWVGEVWSW